MGNYAPVQEIGIGFLFRNSLLPKTLGSGVDYGFFELCSLFNNFRKSVGDFRSPYKEMDVSKGFSTMFNQVFFLLSKQHVSWCELYEADKTSELRLDFSGYDETRREQQCEWELLGPR